MMEVMCSNEWVRGIATKNKVDSLRVQEDIIYLEICMSQEGN